MSDEPKTAAEHAEFRHKPLDFRVFCNSLSESPITGVSGRSSIYEPFMSDQTRRQGFFRA